jgi:hypothetical protein
MVGNLLMAGRSVSFDYNRAGAGEARVFNSGSTSIINPKVADNNSPLPQDRIAFRYNHFNDSLSVVGVSNLPATGPTNFGPFLLDLRTVPTATRVYNVDQYTFQFEKTFFDRQMSLELRVPIQTTLSSNLNLSTGTLVGTATQQESPATIMQRNLGLNAQLLRAAGQGASTPTPGSLTTLGVNPTPDQTLGSERTELGNLSLILKGLLYRSPTVAFSGGLGLGLPTANNTRVRVTDYGSPLEVGTLEWQRVRQFDIKNETVGLSPFFAALYTPGERFFAQGFLQADVPLNTSKVTYTDTVPLIFNENRFASLPGNILAPPFTVTDHLREQALMHVDLGTGYWLVRDPNADWVTGLAPMLELHYTTTLNSADLITLPRDSAAIPITSPPFFRPEAFPTVGNRRGHVDILDLTAGATLFVANRATLATAVSVPLRTGDNRTFDWEFHVQLNYYFGGPSRRGPFAPTF